MKRLIIIGGEAPSSFDFDASVYSAVIAADSGYDTAKRLGIRITDAVGDFDSTAFRSELISMGFIPCCHDKDESDAELALLKGDGPYDLIGGGEGRLDHTLSLIALMARRGAPRLWFTRKDVIVALPSPVRISVPESASLSFFSVCGERRARTEGLVWELDGFPLSPFAVSLSNRAADGTFSIYPEKEIMMRIAPEDYPRMTLKEIL